ncbi:MAG: hypothetical protein AB8B86_07605 [Pseudomonadales bacterium]
MKICDIHSLKLTILQANSEDSDTNHDVNILEHMTSSCLPTVFNVAQNDERMLSNTIEKRLNCEELAAIKHNKSRSGDQVGIASKCWHADGAPLQTTNAN